MTEKLNYYLGSYLHQSWNHEINSMVISDHWDFFFDNECQGKKELEIELGNELIGDIECMLNLTNPELSSFFSDVNYYFPTEDDIRNWLTIFKQWIEKRISQSRGAA